MQRSLGCSAAVEPWPASKKLKSCGFKPCLGQGFFLLLSFLLFSMAEWQVHQGVGTLIMRLKAIKNEYLAVLPGVK